MTDEARTGVRLAFDALGGIVDVVRDVHRAIAGPGLAAVAAPVFGAVRFGLAAGGAVASTVTRGALPVGLTGVVNGAVGDRLRSDYPALATPLRATADGPLEGHVVVFLHGLVHTEQRWGHRDVAEEVGATAVHVRYNSGLSPTDNGRDLAAYLEALVTGNPIVRLSLVGHSMGGLVARAAVHEALGNGQRWLSPLREVVCLGSPHLGSPWNAPPPPRPDC